MTGSLSRVNAANEIQQIVLNGTTAATVSIGDGQNTTTFPPDAPAAQVQNVLAGLSSIGTGNVAVIGSSAATPGGDQTGTGVASASGVIAQGYTDASNAFDNSTSTSWVSGSGPGPHWLRYDFGNSNAKVISGYSLLSNNTRPTAWQFQGSNDDSAWTTLDTRSAQDPTSVAVYSFPNTTAYRYYRLYITLKTDTYSPVYVTEMELLSSGSGYTGSYTVEFVGTKADTNINTLTSTTGGVTITTLQNGGPTPPSAPVGVTFSGVTTSSVTVNLPVLPAGATSLSLQQRLTNDSTYQTVTTGLTGNAAYQITGLNTASYTFRAVAVNAYGSTPGAEATVNLQTPTAVTLSELSSSYYDGNPAVSLSWSLSNDVDFVSYKLYRGTTANVTAANSTLVTTITQRGETSYTDHNAPATAPPGTTCYYKIFVVDVEGQTTGSNERSITLINNLPAAVTLNDPTFQAYYGVGLSWSQSYENDFASYKIYRANQPNVTVANGTLVTTITSRDQTYYTDSNVTTAPAPGTTYYYKAFVFDQAGQSTGSNEKSIVLVDAVPAAVTLNDPSLYSGSNGASSVYLTWSQSSDYDFASYKIYRSTTANVTTSGTLITTITSRDQTSYTDNTVIATPPPGTTYYYKVFVFDQAGQSAASNEKSIVLVGQALTLAVTPASFSEAAGTGAATGTLTRSGATTSALTVTLSSSNTAAATVPATVTIGVGSASATFAVNAVDDAVADGTQTVTLTGTATGFASATTSVSVTDNEQPTLALVVTPTTFGEGAGANAATGTVSRNTATTEALTVTLSNSNIAAATTPATVTIAVGSTSATFAVAAVDDTIVDGTQTATLTASATSFLSGTAALTVTDDDAIPAAPTNLTLSATIHRQVDLSWSAVSDATQYKVKRATVSGGPYTLVATLNSPTTTYSNSGLNNDTTYYYIVTAATATRESAPSDEKSIKTLALEKITGFTAVGGDGQVSLSWDALPGATSYQIYRNTVVGPLGSLLVSPTGTSHIDYDVQNGTRYYYSVRGVNGGGVAWSGNYAKANAMPQKPAGVTLSPISGHTTEAGGTATFTVVLNRQPTANVTIGFSSSTTGEGTVAPSQLTFSSANWNQPQTVTVTGVDDTVADGNVSYTVVTAPASSTDTAFSNLNIDDVTVINDDNDVATLTLTLTPDSFSESAGATAATATVKRNTPTTQALSVTLSSSDTSEAVIPNVVTILSGQDSVSFAVRAVNDTENDGPQSVTLTATAPNFIAGTVVCTVEDNDPPAAPDVPVLINRAQAAVTLELPVLSHGAASLSLQKKLRGELDESYVNVATNQMAEVVVPVADLIAGGSYTFRCVAVNAFGSTPGPGLDVNLSPAPPGLPRFTRVTSYSVDVIAPALPLGATTLILQRKLKTEDATAFADVSVDLKGGSTTKVDNLQPLTAYSFRFLAVGEGSPGVGDSADVTTEPVFLPPLPPNAPTFSAITAYTLKAKAPVLPERASSLLLQKKLAAETNDAYVTIGEQLLGETISWVTDLTASTEYSFRYVAVGPGGMTPGQPANVTTAPANSGGGNGVPSPPGPPHFQNVTSSSVDVVAPILPSKAISLTLQVKLASANDGTYQNAGTGLSGGAITPLNNLQAGMEYTCRYVAVGTIGATPGSPADIITNMPLPGIPQAPKLKMQEYYHLSYFYDKEDIQSITLIAPSLPAAANSLTLEWKRSDQGDDTYVGFAAGLQAGSRTLLPRAMVATIRSGTALTFRYMAVGYGGTTHGESLTCNFTALPKPVLATGNDPYSMDVTAPNILPVGYNSLALEVHQYSYIADLWNTVAENVTPGQTIHITDLIPTHYTLVENGMKCYFRWVAAKDSGPTRDIIVGLADSQQINLPASYYQKVQNLAVRISDSYFSSITPTGVILELNIGEGKNYPGSLYYDPNDGTADVTVVLQKKLAGELDADYATIVTNPTPGSIVPLTNLSPGTGYIFRLLAWQDLADGRHQFQHIAKVITPPYVTPGAPVFTGIGPTSVHVKAPLLSPNAEDRTPTPSYQILLLQRKRADEPAAAFETVAIVRKGGTISKVGGLQPETSYAFRYVSRSEGDLDDINGPIEIVTTTAPNLTWNAATPIKSAGIRLPGTNATMPPNATGTCQAFHATDWDQKIEIINGETRTQAFSDTCHYQWSDSTGRGQGAFVNNRDTGKTVSWIAPSTPGVYTLTLIVDDQNEENRTRAEGGSREDAAIGYNDGSLKFTRTITVE